MSSHHYPEREGEYTVADVKAWREGDWVLVELGGRIVHRRLTRDPAFVTARVRFHSYQSPRKPRIDSTFQEAELRVQPPRRGDDHYNNWLDVPIRASRDGMDS